MKMISSGGRSTRYSRIKKFKERGIIEYDNGKLVINYFSPYTWRVIYENRDVEYIVFRALNLANGVLTGMKIVGLVAPNPYSDIPIYEVYISKDKAEIFASIIGLRDDILVYSIPKSLFKSPLSKTIVLVYNLDKPVEYTSVETMYGFKINRATMEQSLIDVIRNDYWYYRGIAFEVYYYARNYVNPEKLLELAKLFGVKKRLITIDYVVSEVLGIKQLFNSNEELDSPLNLVRIVERLGDVLD